MFSSISLKNCLLSSSFRFIFICSSWEYKQRGYMNQNDSIIDHRNSILSPKLSLWSEYGSNSLYLRNIDQTKTNEWHRVLVLGSWNVFQNLASLFSILVPTNYPCQSRQLGIPLWIRTPVTVGQEESCDLARERYCIVMRSWGLLKRDGVTVAALSPPAATADYCVAVVQ